MNNLITEARELCAAATPGPWKVVDGKSFGVQSENKNIASCFRRENEVFIARSRTIIPELCDALEASQEQNKQLMHEVCKLACESVEREKKQARLEAEVMAACDSVRWIPVTERLPEIDVAVLVLHTYQRDEYSPITIGRLYQPCDKRRNPYWTFVSIQASDGAVYNDGTDFICPGSEYVTHWMPLPQPPKGAGK